MNGAHVVAIGAGVAVLGYYGYAWASGAPRSRVHLRTLNGSGQDAAASNGVQRVLRMTFQDQLQRFATATDRHGNRLFHDIGAGDLPDGARWLTLEPSQPMNLLGFNHHPPYGEGTHDGIVAALNATREALQMGGRGGEDARCVLCRWAEETDWFRALNHYNAGFVKLPHPYASQSSLLGGSPRVGIGSTYPEPTTAFMLTDRLASFDMYYGFPSLPNFATFHKRWFLQNGYSGVIRGYQQGGVEGLALAETTMAERGYSTGYTVAAAQARAPAFWSRCSRLAGADWVR